VAALHMINEVLSESTAADGTMPSRRSLMADEFTLSSHGCHLPTVNEGVQKLSGQKRIEMKY